MNNIIEDIFKGGKFKRLIENVLVQNARDVTELNRVELVIIYSLYRYDNLTTLTDISRYLQMNKGHISTMLDGLGKKGYIICQRDEEDRRYIRYQITEKAEEVVLEMDALWAEMSKGFIQGIGQEDLETFGRVAQQIEGNIERMMKEYGEV